MIIYVVSMTRLMRPSQVSVFIVRSVGGFARAFVVVRGLAPLEWPVLLSRRFDTSAEGTACSDAGGCVGGVGGRSSRPGRLLVCPGISGLMGLMGWAVT